MINSFIIHLRFNRKWAQNSYKGKSESGPTVVAESHLFASFLSICSENSWLKGQKCILFINEMNSESVQKLFNTLIPYFYAIFAFSALGKILSLAMVLWNACVQCTVCMCTNMNWMREHSQQYLFAMSKYNRNRSEWTWFWFYQVGQCLVSNLKWKRCHSCTDCIILHETSHNWNVHLFGHNLATHRCIFNVQHIDRMISSPFI